MKIHHKKMKKQKNNNNKKYKCKITNNQNVIGIMNINSRNDDRISFDDDIRKREEKSMEKD